MSSPPRKRRERLPRGPHGLEPEEVAADQRGRLVDAMVELCGTRGYANTTVADVIALAQVSRKTFYAHFDDRHELLLAAFQKTSPAVLEDVEQAAQRGGGATRRLEAMMRRLCGLALESPGTIAIATIEIAAANPAGLEGRDRLMEDYGDLIERCLSEDGRAELPPTLAQALAGSAHRTIDAHLRTGQADRLSALGPQLARWTRSYDPFPADFEVQEGPPPPWLWAGAELAGGRAPGTLTLAPSDYRPPPGKASKTFVQHANRERILDAVAQIVAEEGYVPLTALAIAERAGLSERAFLAHFKSKDEAFSAAVEIGHMKAQAVVERARQSAGDWAESVRNAVYALVEFLAAEPCFTRLAFVDAPLAGPSMARRMHEQAGEYTQLLLDGAPQRRRPPSVAPEAVVHGLFELAFHYAAGGRVPELLGVAREAAYLVLAPFVGVSEAASAAVA